MKIARITSNGKLETIDSETRTYTRGPLYEFDRSAFDLVIEGEGDEPSLDKIADNPEAYKPKKRTFSPDGPKRPKKKD